MLGPARLATGFSLSPGQSGDDASSPTLCGISKGPLRCICRQAVLAGSMSQAPALGLLQPLPYQSAMLLFRELSEKSPMSSLRFPSS